MTPDDHRLILYYMMNVVAVTGFLVLSAARDGDLLDDSGVDSDEDDDDLEESEIQNENRKRSRSAVGTSTTGSDRRNVRRRVSVNEGIASMENAVSNLVKAIREATTTLIQEVPAVGPSRLTNVDGNIKFPVPVAIALIVANEGLSDAEIIHVAECLIENPDIATIYVSLTNRTVRSRYIRKKVDGFRAHGTAPSSIVHPAATN